MNSSSIADELEAILPSTIALTDAQIEQARQQSLTIQDPTQQWQTYLNYLALLGFEQWLNQRASDISIHIPQNSLRQATEGISVICNVIVNNFKVCLIPIESQPDDVELPDVAITSPELAAHFYITVTIYEELSHVAVHSFLRYDQLTTQLPQLQLDPEQFYDIPIHHFNPDLNHLLLYLRCSQPRAISQQLLAISQQPAANSQQPAANSQQLTANSYQLSVPLINVRRWLQNELDELAQQLSWVLLPPLTLENAMRLTARVVNQPTPQESFENVIKQLVRDGMILPVDARVAYQDLDVAGVPSRLYAIAGTLPPDPTPEWTLLLVLGPRSQTPLPRNTQLQIGVSDTPLTQQTLTQQDNYLYAKVIGTLEEQFWVTITAPNSETIELPTFSY
ncbi:MAG: DUF1822 family protein [Leptolyngbyaceae cyanobacterium bins.349]|nr:DUF1822 family protein [Leptolyngbyaceae cyanobacterium bins.349]